MSERPFELGVNCICEGSMVTDTDDSAGDGRVFDHTVGVTSMSVLREISSTSSFSVEALADTSLSGSAR